MNTFGNSWFGNSWFGNSWGGVGAGGGPSAFAIDETKPFTVLDDSLHTDVTRFPPGYWNPDMLSQIGLIEFFAIKNWDNYIEDTVESFHPDSIQATRDPEFVKGEIEVLKGHLANKDRMCRREEIIQQDQNFQLYWLQMMAISRSSHPKTFFLLKIVARVGELLMIHFKARYHRPRPSQICPALMPLLEVPGHASFPSGHSLLSHLTSLCLSELVPSATKSLGLLADRVAHNREVAGLHYPSDSLAGKQMAAVVYKMLHDCNMFRDTLKKAQEEWSSGSGAEPTPPDERGGASGVVRKDDHVGK